MASSPRTPANPGRFSRRGFLGAAAASAAAALWPGGGATALASPGARALRDDYVGRLCYNENPLGPSPLALAAMAASLELGHRYSDWMAESLRLELAQLHDVSPSWTIAGCGGTEMLNLCARVYAEPGKNVICPNPSYSQFPGDAAFYGAEVRYAALDSNHRVDLVRIAQLIDADTTAICITNANNPTATVLPAASIASFVDELPSGVVLILDEAYHEYTHDPAYASAMDLVRAEKPVVVIRTFSKIFGLAGMRIGYLVAAPPLIGPIAALQTWGTVSRAGIDGGIAALGDAQHVTDTVALNDQAKAYCFPQLTAMGLEYIPSETNFFMVDVGQPAGPVASELAQRGILVRTGWGMPNHLRVSTGTMDDMEAFVTALQEILAPGRVIGTAPAATAMYGNFPNPVEDRTRIVYALAEPGRVRLRIYDLQGRLVRTLLDALQGPGFAEVVWDRADDGGRRAHAGLYYYRLEAGSRAETRRMILL